MAPPFDDRKAESERANALNYFGAMPLGLRSQVYNLATLLTRDVTLMIPRYQRPYSWTEEHVGKLVQDLRRAFERHGAFYFIGHFVLVKTPKNELHVADGQQRLATLTMLFALMRDVLTGRKDYFSPLILAPGARPRLKLRETDQAFFYEHVQTPGRFQALPRMDVVGNDSQGSIVQAAATILDALDDMAPAKLEEFAKFICRCALFDVIEADEAGGAVTVFTTVNDRGLDLSAADLMKSALLERANLSEASKNEAAITWEDLEDRLGRKAFGELLDITPTMFGGEAILAPGDLAAFVQTLYARQSVETFLTDWLPRHGQALFEIRNECVGGPHGPEINRRIRCLKQLKEQTWLPVAVAFLANHGKDVEKTRRFFQGVDLIAFCALLSAVRRENRDLRWRRALAADGDERKLFSPADGALTLRDGELRTLIQRLGAPFKRDHSAESDKRKVILIRINASLPGGEPLTRDLDLTVEHILPVKGGPAWNEKFTPAERAEYAHLIGNWTLVSLRQNQICANKGYDEKKVIFFREDWPVWAVTRTLEREQEWTPFTIDHRRAEFQAALFRDWGL